MTPYQLLKKAETRDKRLKKIAMQAFQEQFVEDVKKARQKHKIKRILTIGLILCIIIIALLIIGYILFA